MWHIITSHIPVGLSYVALWGLTIISGLLAVAPPIAKRRYVRVLLVLTFIALGILGYLSNVHERDDLNASDMRHEQTLTSGTRKITVIAAGQTEILNYMHLPIPGQVAQPARIRQLLYVSDAYGGSDFTGDVAVYSYPTWKQVGTLTGLLEPQGMCTDGNNVFVTSTADSSILEYRWDNSIAKLVLDDSGFLPVGCAFDHLTGDLAVTNVASTSGGNGNVAIYTHASGKPSFRQTPELGRYDFCTYNGSGTLFVDGTGPDNGNRVTLVAFDRGGLGGIINLNQAAEKLRGLNEEIEVPRRLGWDGKYVTVGSDTIIYRLRVSGSRTSVSGETNLSGSAMNYYVNGATMFTVDGKDVFAYRYPSGGAPISQD